MVYLTQDSTGGFCEFSFPTSVMLMVYLLFFFVKEHIFIYEWEIDFNRRSIGINLNIVGN